VNPVIRAMLDTITEDLAESMRELVTNTLLFNLLQERGPITVTIADVARFKEQCSLWALNLSMSDDGSTVTVKNVYTGSKTPFGSTETARA
jgi:hypothetical protein